MLSWEEIPEDAGRIKVSVRLHLPGTSPKDGVKGFKELLFQDSNFPEVFDIKARVLKTLPDQDSSLCQIFFEVRGKTDLQQFCFFWRVDDDLSLEKVFETIELPWTWEQALKESGNWFQVELKEELTNADTADVFVDFLADLDSSPDFPDVFDLEVEEEPHGALIRFRVRDIDLFRKFCEYRYGEKANRMEDCVYSFYMKEAV